MYSEIQISSARLDLILACGHMLRIFRSFPIKRFYHIIYIILCLALIKIITKRFIQ